MALSSGTRIGSYEIVGLLGAGGMGEVYRARDTSLKRDVALKILPEAFARDSDRVARFRREAVVLASLNHPNIATIFGVESGESATALVLEFIDGPTLADRILSGRVPVDEALAIAKQIADAVGAAHEHGIIHRDLKPANIKVRSDGTVKVLDFGLAKTFEHDPAAISRLATATTPAATMEGALLGTAAYMAPEQATGKSVDPRSDIWAFGLVLFEMLTARRGFAGETTVEVLSNVLKSEPDWAALPSATPAGVKSLLRRCLQKDPVRRLRNLADARFAIEDALNEPAAVSPGAAMTTSRRRPLLWLAALVAVAIASTTLTWRIARGPDNADETRLDITTPPTTDPASFALSPDGRRVTFVATSDGQSRLWVRALDETSARTLPGTENATYPFWSHDGRTIAFSVNQQLKRVDVATGSVQLLATGGDLGGDWSNNGTMLFSGNPSDPLFTIGPRGGDRERATEVNAQTENHRLPQFLPDQRHFLFYATGAAPGLYVAELGSKNAPQRLMENVDGARYTSGQLFFVRQRTLFAQRFDPTARQLSGDPIAVADRIVLGATSGVAAMSVAETGQIAFRSASGAAGVRELTWFDRTGRVLERVAGSAVIGRSSLSLSPDGRHVAFEQLAPKGTTTDIWVLDLVSGIPSRLTSDPAFDLYPQWSPDGRSIAFSSTRQNKKGRWDLYLKPATRSGDEEVLVATNRGEVSLGSWSPDGRWLLYAFADRPGDVMALPVEGDRKPITLIGSTFDELLADVSPDGRWMTFQSDESGRFEVYVAPFSPGSQGSPGSRARHRISTEGGSQAKWSPNGREIFYLGPNRELMSVPIKASAAGDDIEIGKSQVLFSPPLPTTAGGWQYAVARDGQRFLVDTLKEVTIPITLIQNWKAPR